MSSIAPPPGFTLRRPEPTLDADPIPSFSGPKPPPGFKLRRPDTLPANDVAAGSAGPTAGDVAKAFGAGAVSGAGYGLRGMGEAFREGGELVASGINALAGTELRATNFLKRPAEALEGWGGQIRDSISEGGRAAMRDSTPRGDITDPSSWSLGDNPSLGGYALQTADVTGQIAPVAAAAALTRGQSLTAQLGASAATAATMSGGGAASSEGGRIRGMDAAGLAQVPLYAKLVEGGMSPEAAREETALMAEKGAFRFGAPMGALSGLLLGGVLSKAGQGFLARGLSKMGVGTGVIPRAIAGTAVEAPLEGLQEVGETVAMRAGAGMHTGEKRDLTADTVGDFVLGAAGAAGPSVLGAVLERPRFPGAQPGSLADAANAIPTIKRPEGLGEAASPVAPAAASAQPGSLVEASAALAPVATPRAAAAPATAPAATVAAPAAAPTTPTKSDSHAKGAKTASAAPIAPPWVNAETGEVGQPTPEGLVQAIRSQMVEQYRAHRNTHLNTLLLGEAWGVPAKSIQQAARKLEATFDPRAYTEPLTRAGTAQERALAPSGELALGTPSPLSQDTPEAANVDGPGRAAGALAEGGDEGLGAVPEPVEGAAAADRAEPVVESGQPAGVSAVADAALDGAAARAPAADATAAGDVATPRVAEAPVTAEAAPVEQQQLAAAAPAQLPEPAAPAAPAAAAPPSEQASPRVPAAPAADPVPLLEGAPEAAPAQPSAIQLAADTAATSPANDRPEPTEAQKEAGNYAKGHVRLHGHEISIENPAGTSRRPEWPPIKHHYGYIRGTVGKDKDHVDVFLTDQAEDASRPVFVVDQRNKDGSFDEHKVVMGAANEAEAREAYLSNYAPGWDGLAAITQMTQEQFKVWVRSPNKTKRPASPALRARKPAVAAPDGKIVDLGEKIGGARKDTAVSTGRASPRAAATAVKDERPTWAKRYSIQQIAASKDSAEVGKWVIRDERKKDWRGAPVLATSRKFSSREEAEQSLLLVELARQHRAVPRSDGGWGIARDVTDRKRIILKEGFKDREEAMRYMAEHAQELLETVTSVGEEALPLPKSVQRDGPARRTGDVEGKDFMATFGFRGVEFGNWNNQAERQEVMNFAFDGLHDLAGVLGIPPKAISLNGELALAFGARGHGLSGARAHYEPVRGVINLTKMQGAGALAHEWLHALDHYLGRQAGTASAERTRAPDGGQQWQGAAAESFLSHGAHGRHKDTMRPELRAAYRRVIDTMLRKAEKYVTDTQQAERFVGHARDQLGSKLQEIRDSLAKPYPYAGRGKTQPASPELLAELDTIITRLVEGQDLELRTIETGAKVPKHSFGGMRRSNDSLERINAIMKEVRGRQGFNAELKGPLDYVRGMMSNYQARLQLLADARKGTEQSKQMPTSFKLEAVKADQGRATDYWATPHEMAARAFSAYVEDKLSDAGGVSNFLSYGSEHRFVLPIPEFPRPFPGGDERAAINAAFDAFFQEVKTEETDQGVRLFSQPSVAGAAGLERAVVQALVDRVAKGWSADAPAVRVVADAKDLPAAAKADPDHASAEGFYDGRTVWLVASNLASERRALQVLAHEAIGHYGVDRVLGEKQWREIVASIQKLASSPNTSAGLKAVIQDVRDRYEHAGALDPETFAREVIAVMAERGLRNALWHRVVSAVRRFLRALFPGVTWSESELNRLLVDAHQFLARGESPAARVRRVQAMSFSREKPEAPFKTGAETSEAARTGDARAGAMVSEGASGGTVTRVRSLGIPAAAGEPLSVFRTDAEIKAHPRYREAKAGDAAAAVELVRDLAQPLKAEAARFGSDVIYVAPHAEEATGDNAIPQVLAAFLASAHGARSDVEITQENKVYHTGANAMQRLIAPSTFTGEVVKGGRYVMVDDVTTLGGTLSDLANYILMNGGEVVGSVVLVNAARSGKIIPKPAVIRALEGRHGDEIRGTLGIEPGALTAEEAGYLLGFRSADELRNRAASAAEERDRRLRAKGVREERLSDTDSEDRAPPSEGLGVSEVDELDLVQSLSPAERQSAAVQGLAAAMYHEQGTDSPFFRDWFKQSRVTRNGAPLRVFHGTAADFDAFDANHFGGATAHTTAPLGFFFAEDRAKAEHYAQNAAQGVPADERVVEAYLSIQKPYDLSVKDFQAIDSTEAATALREKLVKQGYDGIRVTEFNQWIAFEPTQIKAVSNRGTFDAAVPNMLFSKPARAVMADRIEQLLRDPNENLFQRLKGKLEDWRPKWLSLLTLRHLSELAEPYLPQVRIYSDLVQQIATDRNVMQEEGGKVAQDWQQWAAKNRGENERVVDLMHDATIEGTDPAEDFESIPIVFGRQKIEATRENVKEALAAIREQMRGRSGDVKGEMLAKAKHIRNLPARNKRRKARHAELVARWQALSPQAQAHYRAVRDLYVKRRDEREAALVQRIKDLKLDAGLERAQIDLVREKFEAARVESPYFPLQRFGDFWIAATSPAGEKTYLMRETYQEWQRAARELKDAGFTIDKIGRKGEQSRALDGASGSFVTDVIQKLKSVGIPESVQDEIYQMYLQSLPDLSQRKHSIHRKKVEGYSKDAIRAFGTNMLHEAHQIARMRYSHQLEGLVNVMGDVNDARREKPDADLKAINAADALLAELKKRHAWIMAPTDSNLTNAISSLGFVYYLGLTPAAALVNLTQNAITTFPALATRYGPMKAMNALLAGMRDSIRTGGNIQRTLTSEDEQNAHAALRAMGAIDKSQAHNLAGIAEGDSARYNPKWAKAMEIVSALFHKAEVVNREASGMAAFRLARAEGKSFDEAVRYASETIWQTHFDYSNANRARFMQSGTAKVLLMFRQYSLNMTWFLARNAYQSVKGQSPEVRRQALRTLAGTLGMTGIFAGALGLPVLGVVFSLLNAAHASFGDDDEPWDAETEFRNFLADHLGAEAANVLAVGPVNALTGADIAGRVSLGGLWFRDADRELEGRDAYFHLLEQVAGPIGGIGKNLLVGKQLMDEGHLLRGVETIMPKAIKDGIRSMRFASEGVNNLRGDPIVEDLNAYQTLLQLAGFSPAVVSEQYDANRAVKNYEQAILQRRQRLMDAYAMAVRLQDAAARSETLEKVRHFNAANPEIPITNATIRRSIRDRLRYSARAEGGIVLNRRLERRAREQARFQAEG